MTTISLNQNIKLSKKNFKNIEELHKEILKIQSQRGKKEFEDFIGVLEKDNDFDYKSDVEKNLKNKYNVD